MRSDATAAQVSIEWWVEGLPGTSFTAYRRAGAGAWSAIATLSADGAGRVRLQDSDVRPGGHYDYRLGSFLAGQEQFYAEVSVEVPLADSFSLDGARPNPAHGALLLAFALPVDGPVSLELLDVSGRRVLERRFGGLGAGRHVLRIAEPGELSPGLYFARLTQGGEHRIARVVVAR